MRKQRFQMNTIFSLLYQITTILCGFVIPRLIINGFGSDTNGLVNSIAQFLSIISFLEFGVGAVIQSSFYKPLADNDNKKISEIYVSGQKFFQRIAQILMIYIIILMITYPLFLNQDRGWLYTSTLIVTMSISSFAQYYFGIVDSLLLTADQRGYIQYSAQIVTTISNTICCAVLIYFGFGIHFVRLSTSLIYVLRPIFLRWYVLKHYSINREIIYEGEPIKQKWNGFAQHISNVVLSGTDNIVLTIFSTLANVSVYSVYNLVVNGIKTLFTSLNSGFHALIGELWARQELEKLNRIFGMMEWYIHTACVFVFGCTYVLLIPFVMVYTNGIDDINYIYPVFSDIITLAWAFNCLSIPYHAMILAAGHYKETQKYFVISAILNIVISIATVYIYGLIGVALGTLIAMVYQVLWMTKYVSKNINKWPVKNMIKQFAVDLLMFVVGVNISSQFQMKSISFVSWFILALKVAAVWVGVIVILDLLFYRRTILESLKCYNPLKK